MTYRQHQHTGRKICKDCGTDLGPSNGPKNLYVLCLACLAARIAKKSQPNRPK